MKIGDFGLSSLRANCSDPRSVRSPEGSILWMAPEIITARSFEEFDFKSDIYAFGIVLYELLSNILPYSDGGSTRCGKKYGTPQLSGVQIMWLVGTGLLIPNMDKIAERMPQSLRSLLMKCIKFTSAERPDFSEVLAILENAILGLPKISRTVSEPILNSFICEKVYY